LPAGRSWLQSGVGNAGTPAARRVRFLAEATDPTGHVNDNPSVFVPCKPQVADVCPEAARHQDVRSLDGQYLLMAAFTSS